MDIITNKNQMIIPWFAYGRLQPPGPPSRVAGRMRLGARLSDFKFTDSESLAMPVTVTTRMSDLGECGEIMRPSG
jgi:hypothetical protein